VHGLITFEKAGLGTVVVVVMTRNDCKRTRRLFITPVVVVVVVGVAVVCWREGSNSFEFLVGLKVKELTLT